MKQILVGVLALLVMASCNQRRGSGNVVTETRQTGEFTGISVGGSFTVELALGPVTEVKVEADDNIIHDIETRVSGNVLKIGTKDHSGFRDATLKVYITAPEINKINASGAAQVKVAGELKSRDKIALDVSGASAITTAVDAPEISAEVSGAGHIDVKGRTRQYTAEVSGSGELKSGDLKSEETEVRVSGAGNARVYASVKLKAEASGAGNIYYRGGATVDSKTSGAGNVKNEN